MPKITTIHHAGTISSSPFQNKDCGASTSPKRVAAYCRVSTLAEEQNLSYDAQQHYYKVRFKHDPNHVLVQVYGDHGITGTSAEKRPGFQEMLHDCKSGLIDEIYTKSVSRFARNFAECLEYMRELKRLGVVIHFEKENFSSADSNIDMILSLMAIIAQEESNSISQNISFAQRFRNKKGDPACKAAYGYRRDMESTDGIHVWRIQEDEARRVRVAFSLYLQKQSITAVSKELNCYEEKHNGNKKWTPRSVSSLLRREAYVGDLITNKTYKPDYLSSLRKVNHGERLQYYLRDHHPAIISRDVFEETQKLLGRDLPSCMKTD